MRLLTRFVVGMLLVATCFAAQAQEKAALTKTFRSETLNLTFQYPEAWKFEKLRDRIRFTIPFKGTREAATSEIFDVDFRQPIEEWQRLQKAINDQMNRTVERQWTEELLSVPFVMTRISYVQGGQETTTLIGLLYSATKLKFHFRLTASTQRFPEVEQAWRDALLSIRTITGSLTSDNPEQSLPTQPKVIPPTKTRPPLILKTDAEIRRERAKLGPVKVPLVVSTRKVELSLANGFTTTLEGSVITIKHPQLSGLVTVEVNSILDSPRPERALADRAGQSLTEFTKVDRRRDQTPKVSTVGSMVAWTRREGAGANGPLVILDVVGDRGDYYWVMRYRATGPEMVKSDDEILQSLINSLAATAAP